MKINVLTNTSPPTEDTTFTQVHLSQYLEENNLDHYTLIEFTVPNGITKIQAETFRSCTSLTSIVLPDSLAEIRERAFHNCTSLTAISLPDSLTEIGAWTFCNCTSLTSIVLPDGITQIGEHVFYDCTSLTAITLPDSLTKIGAWTFCNCTSLTSIELPDSLTIIVACAFDGCTSLTSIELPAGLTEIRNHAFEHCTSLTSIDLPDSLTEIGQRSFYKCTSLASIELPKGLTEIGWGVFEGCDSLQYIVINKVYEWSSIGINTSRTNILTYTQYLEQKHASLMEETGMHNLQPHEADLIYKMINDQGYLPTWDILKDTFPNRSITQLHDLLITLGKNIEAFNDVIPSIEVSIKDISNIYHSIFLEKINDIFPIIGIIMHDMSSIYHSILAYMSIKDCESLLDAAQHVNRFLQNKIEQHQDNLPKMESEQNLIEPDNSTAKIPDSRSSHN